MDEIRLTQCDELYGEVNSVKKHKGDGTPQNQCSEISQAVLNTVIDLRVP